MRESAQAAMSYLKSHTKPLALDVAAMSKTDVHIHVPAGAVPKDGPSAGVAITAALLSLFRKQPILTELAMTGEVTLTGRVLPVGGVRDKVLAARRAGIKTILLPRHNEKDLVELPTDVKADLTFRLIDTLDDVVPRLFESREVKSHPKPDPVKPKAPKLSAEKAPTLAPPANPKSDASTSIKPTRRPRTV
jgi:ATP-dependent Lon protease